MDSKQMEATRLGAAPPSRACVRPTWSGSRGGAGRAGVRAVTRIPGRGLPGWTVVAGRPRCARMCATIWATLALLAAAGPSAAQGTGASLWDDAAGNRYANRKAVRIGDLITVLVIESSEGSNRSSLKTKKESTIDANGGPGRGPLGFLPIFNAKTSVKDEMDGSGATSVSGQLTAKITVQVIEVRPNGNLVIEGSRLVNVNGDEDRITLHGVVRPEDIRADNTVLSTYLSEARIAYQGKGPTKSAARRGVLLRIVSWFF